MASLFGSSARVEAKGVPLALAFDMWTNKSDIPQWMPWITSVKVLPEDPRMSRWTLSTHQFGRQWEFSWLAQNLAPLKNQKIHWRSVPGSVGGSLGAGVEVANRQVGALLARVSSIPRCGVMPTPPRHPFPPQGPDPLHAEVPHKVLRQADHQLRGPKRHGPVCKCESTAAG